MHTSKCMSIWKEVNVNNAMVLQCKTAELSVDVFFLDQTLDSNSYCIDCELPSGTFQCLEANLFQG